KEEWYTRKGEQVISKFKAKTEYSVVSQVIMNDKGRICIGIINVSDRASQGIYEDTPGQAIVATLNEYLTSSWEKEYAVIPDEQAVIEKKMISMADEKG